MEAITRFTTFATSNKNPHHFFDGHSYLRVAFFPTTMKERVTFYVDGFKYTIPEEWDKKRKNLIDSLIQGRNKSVQPMCTLMTDLGLSAQKTEFCKKYRNFVAETLIIRMCRFEYAVNRLFFSAHSYQ